MKCFSLYVIIISFKLEIYHLIKIQNIIFIRFILKKVRIMILLSNASKVEIGFKLFHLKK